MTTSAENQPFSQTITFDSDNDTHDTDEDELPQSPVIETRKRATSNTPVTNNTTNSIESNLRKEWREAVNRRDEYLEQVHMLTMKVTQLEEENTKLVKHVNELEIEREENTERVKGLIGILEGMKKQEKHNMNKKLFVEKLATNHAKRTVFMLRFQKRMAQIEKEKAIEEILKEKEVLEEKILDLENKLEKENHEKEKGDGDGDDKGDMETQELEKTRERVKEYQSLIQELAKERSESQMKEREKQDRIHLLENQLRANEENQKQRDDVSYVNVKERERKRAIIDAQDAEIYTMRETISCQSLEIEHLKNKLNNEIEMKQKIARKHQLELRAERTKSRQEVDRLGKLFTAMLHDYTGDPAALQTAQEAQVV